MVNSYIGIVNVIYKPESQAPTSNLVMAGFGFWVLGLFGILDFEIGIFMTYNYQRGPTATSNNLFKSALNLHETLTPPHPATAGFGF